MEKELKIIITIPEREIKNWHMYDSKDIEKTFDKIKKEVRTDFKDFLSDDGIRDYGIEITIN